MGYYVADGGSGVTSDAAWTNLVNVALADLTFRVDWDAGQDLGPTATWTVQILLPPSVIDCGLTGTTNHAQNSGYFVVTVDGVVLSNHTTEREAVEAAVNAELANPGKDVRYRHDYEVKVEEVIPAPTPVPTPTPTPTLTPTPTPTPTPTLTGLLFSTEFDMPEWTQGGGLDPTGDPLISTTATDAGR
jgi:hypothetical protein